MTCPISSPLGVEMVRSCRQQILGMTKQKHALAQPSGLGNAHNKTLLNDRNLGINILNRNSFLFG